MRTAPSPGGSPPSRSGSHRRRWRRSRRSGPDLVAFYRALNGLYTRSARGTIPTFFAEYLDRGKPESIVKLARQNRFRADIPQVIRPDLILTDGGFVASELDSVPGGMGFVGAMAHTYCELGLDTVGDDDGMPRAFAAMLAATAQKERPFTAIVVSEESADYRGELTWLAERIRALGLGDAYVCAPQDIVFTEEALFLRHDDGREDRIDVLYRNFELFDLFNVPKQELMLYAARHNRVKMTPPPKAQLEEKSAFALLHHPLLEALWRKELGDDVFARLQAIFPQTWVLDPRPLPPQAAIIGLTADGVPVSRLDAAGDARQRRTRLRRQAVGFQRTGLGFARRPDRQRSDARRVDSARWPTAWRAFEKTPHILQRFHKGRRVRVEYFDPGSEGMRTMDGRVRLTPVLFRRPATTVRAGRHSRHRRTGRQAAHPRHERCDHGALRDRRGRRLSAAAARSAWLTMPLDRDRRRPWPRRCWCASSAPAWLHGADARRRRLRRRAR